MKLNRLLSSDRPTLSFEVFPPKTSETFAGVADAALRVADLKPHFMSVTCGAGGTTDAYTDDIAARIIRDKGVTAIEHITCVAARRETLQAHLDRIQELGVENVLALRGDLPEGYDPDADHDFRHASELIAYIRARSELCIGGACYPEGHPESPDMAADIDFIYEKQQAGCGFVTTQMFFDNNILYKYLYKLRARGVTIPVVAGIMPVTNAAQLTRIRKLSGSHLPMKFLSMVDRFGHDPAAMRQAGVIYATEQIVDLLANGVTHIHVYSMNKPDVARQIRDSLNVILPTEASAT